jgi:hypothetical protein
MILLVALLMTVTACTSTEPSATTLPPSATTAGDATPDSATTVPGTATTTPTEPTEDQTTTSSSPDSEGPPYIEGIILPRVSLLTATSGGGERPLLEWDPVDGAAWYQAIVINPNGETYWSWPTRDTEVHVSGVESAGARSPGPRIVPNMAWAVLAYDDTDQLMAQSHLRPIGP